MARTPLSLEGFRVAYRALLDDLASKLGIEFLTRLIASPLAIDSMLGIGFSRRKLSDLLRKIPSAQRDEFEAAARSVIREVINEQPEDLPGFAVGEEAAPVEHRELAYEYDAGAAADDDSFIERGLPMAPSPSPSPAPPAVPRMDSPPGWTHAKPPLPMAPPPDEGGGLLSDEPQPVGAAPPGDGGEDDDDSDGQPDVPRYLNAAIAGRAKDAPLTPKEPYVLEVGVGLTPEGDARSAIPGTGLLFEESEDVIELTVQVTSTDFTVEQSSLPLKLPRTGPSRGKARFDVTPKEAGRGTLTISLHKQGNFILQMEVSYSVGVVAQAPTQKVSGRSLNAAEQLRKRELGMTIKPAAGGYECTVRGATHTSVILPLTETELHDAVKVARDALLAVIGMRDDNRALVFQKGVAIDEASQGKALALLARAGAALFRALFYGPKAGKDVRDIGDRIKRMATKPGSQLTLQVVAHEFPVPWGMIYVGSDSEDATLEWSLFLGMRHVIEVIPLQTDALVDDTVIVSDQPNLSVSVNVNAGIDAQMKTNVVARQVKFWDDGALTAGDRLGLAQRSTRKQVLDALRRRTNDQLMYFYCHAVTNGPADPGGIKGSYMVLTNDEHLSVDDLAREAPMQDPLPGNPLVFINACESGELRPEFYDGFIPYFMAKGARGVVGTECKTPAIFATEWALQFFPRFLNGEPLGELFLDLRRSFNREYRNPLGLVYAVYCNGDTQVQPSVTL